MSNNYDPYEGDRCPGCVDCTPQDVSGVKVQRKTLYAFCRELTKGKTLEEKMFYKKKFIEYGLWFDPKQTVDIYSRGDLEQRTLSNFDETDFKLDGVRIASMEGFLQSLKTPDIKEQKRICSLIGKKAKDAGLAVPNFDGEHLYWQGKTINRFSEEYHTLLRRAYRARFENDPLFREMLEESKNKKLIHSIGNNNSKETILTTDEFIGFLRELQEKV